MSAENISRNPDVRKLCLRKRKFHPDAYALVHEAVISCPAYLNNQSPTQHVSGQALLDVIRQILIQRYGPFAIDVLQQWQVERTEDFGEIVFDLVDLKLLGVSPNDSIHDFDDGYDFVEAFVLPYR